MNLNKLGIKEIMLLFFNFKGANLNNNTGKYKVCHLYSDIPNSFILETRMTKSKKNPDIDPDTILELKAALNDYYSFPGHTFKHSSQYKIILGFKNVDNKSIIDFSNEIFDEIKRRQLSMDISGFSKELALSAFTFRGSFDSTDGFYSVDLHHSRFKNSVSINQLMKILVLAKFNDYLNINFRELQKVGSSKDTQLRINLNYFNNEYSSLIANIHPYRYRQFKKHYNSHSMNYNVKKNVTGNFYDRILFYNNNILLNNDKLDKEDIKSMRDSLGFSEKKYNGTPKRSNKSRDFAMYSKPDRCAGCHNVHNKSERTFKLRNSSFWYFEMHHVISYANGKSLDIKTENPDNYVKLCPVCHRILTPNRAEKDIQFAIIKNILSDDDDTLNYVISIQKNLGNTDNPVKFVYKHLK